MPAREATHARRAARRRPAGRGARRWPRGRGTSGAGPRCSLSISSFGAQLRDHVEARCGRARGTRCGARARAGRCPRRRSRPRRRPSRSPRGTPRTAASRAVSPSSIVPPGSSHSRRQASCTSSTRPSCSAHHQRPAAAGSRVELVELGLRAGEEVEQQVLVALLRQRRRGGSTARPSRTSRGPIGVISTRRGSSSESSSSSASARMIRTSSRDSESPSATPSPHSTTVTGLVERGVEVEVVELVDAAEPVGVDVHQRRARRPATGARGRSRTSAR